MDVTTQFLVLGCIFLAPAVVIYLLGNSGFGVSFVAGAVMLIFALITGNIVMFSLINAGISAVIIVFTPSFAEIARRKMVAQARDEFYLREQEKAKSPTA